MNGNRWSSHVEKSVVMSLVVLVIEAGGNAVKAGVSCSMSGNVKFWVLDLEIG